MIDAENPGLLVLIAERRSQRTVEIRDGMGELAIQRLEVGDAVLIAEGVVDLERPDVIGDLRRVHEGVIVGRA